MIEMPLTMLEGIHLARIVADFRELVGEDRDVVDPAIARLTPNAYPDDPAASLDFSETTRDDLLDRRVDDANVVAEALAGFDVDIDSLSQEDALAQRTIVIADAELDAWLRTLAAIRLVLASRLGVTEEEQDADDERYAVYDWLGFRLESLIQAADETA